MEKKHLSLIILAAAAIRLSFLASSPPALNWDEVSHGYNAYSILKTGADEWGHKFPLIFRAYGDYKLPLYIYSTVISEFIFGLNEFAVRLPSALAGIGTVFFSYLLTKKLFSQKIALLTALLVALEPWGLFQSRIAAEANFSVFLIVSGTYFYLEGLKKKHWKTLLGVVLLGLSVWTYNSARLFTPLLLTSLFIVFKHEHVIACRKKSVALLYSLLVLIFFIPMFIQLLNPQGQARYGNVQIINEGAIAKIEEQRNLSTEPEIIKRLKYNRPAVFVKEASINYIAHFSPSFLFLNGGDNFQFNIPETGLLYLINLPLFYFGLYIAAKNYKKKEYSLALIWLFLAPLAASVTRESPHTLRSIIILPIPMLLSALGAVSLSSALKKNQQKYAYTTYVILVLLSAIVYINKYTGDYTKNYSQAWQYGNKEVATFINDNFNTYDKIIMTKKYGEPHEFLLFYLKWDPASFVSDAKLNRFNQSNWWWVDGFDKLYFVNDWEIPTEPTSAFIQESGNLVECSSTETCLLVTTERNAPENWSLVTDIKFLNGEIAYELYTN